MSVTEKYIFIVYYFPSAIWHKLVFFYIVKETSDFILQETGVLLKNVQFY